MVKEIFKNMEPLGKAALGGFIMGILCGMMIMGTTLSHLNTPDKYEIITVSSVISTDSITYLQDTSGTVWGVYAKDSEEKIPHFEVGSEYIITYTLSMFDTKEVSTIEPADDILALYKMNKDLGANDNE